MKKRVVIAGANGFIGRHLVKYLRQINEFDVETFQSDIAKRDSYEGVYCSHFINLAAESDEDDEYTIIETALFGTFYAIMFCIKNGSKLIMMSNKDCRNRVMRTANYISQSLIHHMSSIGLRSLLLETPEIFGPGLAPFQNSNIATAMHLVSQNKDPSYLEKEPCNNNAYVHIDDVCSCIEALLHAGDEYSESNLSVPGSFVSTFDDILRILLKEENNRTRNAVSLRTKHLLLSTLESYT